MDWEALTEDADRKTSRRERKRNPKMKVDGAGVRVIQRRIIQRAEDIERRKAREAKQQD